MSNKTMLCAGLLAVSSLVAAEPALAADAKAATGSDKAAIEARENTYNEGFNSRDVENIMYCYAPGKKLFVFDVISSKRVSQLGRILQSVFSVALPQ